MKKISSLPVFVFCNPGKSKLKSTATKKAVTVNDCHGELVKMTGDLKQRI